MGLEEPRGRELPEMQRAPLRTASAGRGPLGGWEWLHVPPLPHLEPQVPPLCPRGPSKFLAGGASWALLSRGTLRAGDPTLGGASGHVDLRGLGCAGCTHFQQSLEGELGPNMSLESLPAGVTSKTSPTTLQPGPLHPSLLSVPGPLPGWPRRVDTGRALWVLGSAGSPLCCFPARVRGVPVCPRTRELV